MLYATVSRGYRPGGNNRRPGVNPYDADTLDNCELGWKTRFGPFTFNGAAFYEKWKKVQFGLVPLGNNGTTNTYNAGGAQIYGLEGNFSARFGGLMLSAAGTHVDAKLTSDLCQVDPVTSNIVCLPGIAPAAAKGTRLPVMPRFKGNATARYEFPVGSATAFVQGSVRTRAAPGRSSPRRISPRSVQPRPLLPLFFRQACTGTISGWMPSSRTPSRARAYCR